MTINPPPPDFAPAKEKNFFGGIDILRAVAAIAVVIYHVIEFGKWDGFPRHGVLSEFRIGGFGVDLFLVISGFVILYSALTLLRTRAVADFRREFAERRLRRIVPLYALTFFVSLFLVDPSLLRLPFKVLGFQLLTHATFTHNLFPEAANAVDSPNWSVALEMQFYLLVLLAAPIVRRLRSWHVLAAGCVLAVVFRFVVIQYLLPETRHPHWVHGMTTWLPGSMDEFAAGMALAMVMASGRSWLARWLQPSWPRFLVTAMVAWILMALAMKVYRPRGSYWDIPAMVVWWRVLMSAGLVGIVAAAVCAPAGLLWRLWPLRYLGEISYGIYLWHQLVLLTMLTAGFRGIELLMTTLTGTFVLASISWYYFEKPFVERRLHVTLAAPAHAVA